MIFYLVTQRHAYTLDVYLETWGRDLRQLLRPISYEEIAYFRNLQAGAYIFADLERLNDAQMKLARIAWQALSETSRGACLLNNPSKVLRREALLRELHRAGKNPFAVYRSDENLESLRFPCFIRCHNDHDGSLTGLLHSHEELVTSLAEVNRRGVPSRNLLIVEYCNTLGPDGVFRKYSAFRVGNRIIARHLLHGHDWVLKSPDLVDEKTVAEEEAYLNANPHETELSDIFRLAGIDYGRIDYSLLNGKIITWEINTNPIITVVPAKVHPDRLRGQSWFAAQFKTAIAALDSPPSGLPAPMNLSIALFKELGICWQDRLRRRGRNALRAFTAKLWP